MTDRDAYLRFILDIHAPMLEITHPISPEVLRELLTYNPDTGKLFWKPRPSEMFKNDRGYCSWNTRHAHAEAFTSLNPQGSLTGSIFGKTYLAHRVAWALYHGEWPSSLNHVNGRHDDNRITNLCRAGTGKALIQTRIDEAVELAMRYSSLKGERHKDWVIDQMVRALTGDKLEQKREDKMNRVDELDYDKRTLILKGLEQCAPHHHEVFRRFYARGCPDMSLKEIVADLPKDKVQHALLQVQNTLEGMEKSKRLGKE